MKELQKVFDQWNTWMESGEYLLLRNALREAQPANIAEYLDKTTVEYRLLAFRLLPKDVAAEVFSHMDNGTREHIVQSITDGEVSNIIEEMFLDDTVDFLEEAPANLVKKVLRNTDTKTRILINRFLQYAENSAGSLMTVEFVKLRASLTVGTAMAQIKRTGQDKETIYTCYVADEERRLIGVVPLRTLLYADETTTIESLMQKNVVSVLTTDDQEDVAGLFQKHNWIALPVTDGENRLVGIITVDDIMDVMEQETTEDMAKMAAVLPSDEPYLKTGVLRLAKNRMAWLCVLMISGTLSAFVIQQYEDILSSVIVLSAYMTVITDTGGNAGSQASSLIIRAIALGEVGIKDAWRVVWKEFRVGLVCGGVLTALNLARMTVFSPTTSLAVDFTVSISMGAAVILAKTLGSILPIFAKAVKLDPAMMAGPLITTVVDSAALLIYFTVASIFIL